MIALAIWAGIVIVLLIGLTLWDRWMLGRGTSGPWPPWKRY